MWRRLDHWLPLLGLAALTTAARCGPNPDTRGAAPFAGTSECPDGGVDPATAAPAVGLWADQGGEQVRVTARIGQPEVPTSASGAVAHRVETLETRDGKPPLRAARDSATVQLGLLPPYVRDRVPPEPPSPVGTGSHPVATYPLSENVVLASYESCASLDPRPLVRYFRRDKTGQVVTDVMLHRRSVSP